MRINRRRLPGERSLTYRQCIHNMKISKLNVNWAEENRKIRAQKKGWGKSPFSCPSLSSFNSFPSPLFPYVPSFFHFPFFLKAVLVHSKIEREDTVTSRTPPCPCTTHTDSPIIHTPTRVIHLWQWTHVVMSESPQVHRSHENPLLMYILWVWKMCNDMSPPLSYHTGWIHCLKKSPVCSTLFGLPW